MSSHACIVLVPGFSPLACILLARIDPAGHERLHHTHAQALAEAAAASADPTARLVRVVARRMRQVMREYRQTAQDMFAKLDTNSDGRVDVHELKNGLRAAVGIVLSDAEAQAIFHRFDEVREAFAERVSTSVSPILIVKLCCMF